MTSSRYAPAIVLLLFLALIPTVIHSYLGLKTNDGILAENISPQLGSFRSETAKRNKSWGEDVFGSQSWIERIYNKPGYPAVRLFVARSFDHKRLYHHPELALSYGKSLQEKGIVLLQGEKEIPVRLLQESTGREFVAYALVYGEGFVSSPISHQIRDSIHMLIGAKSPMTLFYVSSKQTNPGQKFEDTAAAKVLRMSIENYLKQK